jgi:hypothetical protein
MRASDPDRASVPESQEEILSVSHDLASRADG